MLRQYYSMLLSERHLKLENCQVHEFLTSRSDVPIPDVYLCDNCWKILVNFFNKEATIRESFNKAINALPTVEVTTIAQGSQNSPLGSSNTHMVTPILPQSTPSRKRPRRQPKGRKIPKANVRMKVKM